VSDPHNTVRIHVTIGDVLALENAIPVETHRRSAFQHLVARIAGEARRQLEGQGRNGGKPARRTP